MSKNAALPIIATGDFMTESRPVICPLANSRELFDIYRLTYDSYSGENALRQLDGLWIPHPDFDHVPETTIFVAKLEDELVGTVSVTLDKGRGLPLEKKFSSTCTLMRAQGRPLAQVWRLLVKESCLLDALIVRSLFTEAIRHLASQSVQTGLFVVQEKHAALCEDLLTGAVPLVLLKSAPGLSNAQSVLLRGDMRNLKSVGKPIQEAGNAQPAYLGRR